MELREGLGPNGALESYHSSTELILDSDKVTVQVDLPRRKDKALAGTWNAHINNMVKGVTSGFKYNESIIFSLPYDSKNRRKRISCQQLRRKGSKEAKSSKVLMSKYKIKSKL